MLFCKYLLSYTRGVVWYFAPFFGTCAACILLGREQASWQPSVLGLQSSKLGDPFPSSSGTPTQSAGEAAEHLAADWWLACGMPWVAIPPG